MLKDNFIKHFHVKQELYSEVMKYLFTFGYLCHEIRHI
jgi:hypothetical protein